MVYLHPLDEADWLTLSTPDPETEPEVPDVPNDPVPEDDPTVQEEPTT